MSRDALSVSVMGTTTGQSVGGLKDRLLVSAIEIGRMMFVVIVVVDKIDAPPVIDKQKR